MSEPRTTVLGAGDLNVLDVSGPITDVAEQLERHQSDSIWVRNPGSSLEFLRPAAKVLRRLVIYDECGDLDLSVLAAFEGLQKLHLNEPRDFGPLAVLPRLTELSVGGWGPWHQLSKCRALRELTVYAHLPPEQQLADLRPLQGLEQLEYLRLDGHQLASVEGIEALVSLRSLVLERVRLASTTGSDYVNERFGFDISRLVPRRPSDERRLRRSRWFLHVDQRKAERVLASIPVERLYTAPITPARPGCIILLVDRSGSTRFSFGEDYRVRDTPEAEGLTPEQLAKVERSLGSELSRSEGMARAINRFLPALAERCGDAAKLEIGLVEYGERVGHAWSGPLAGRALVPLNEVVTGPLRVDESGPVWIEPEAGGRTPLRDALQLTTRVVEEWCRAHPKSYPPIVINLFGEEANPGDIYRDAWALRSNATEHGSALLFWIAKRFSSSSGMFGSAELITGNEHHFRLASPMPPTIEDAARRAGYPLVGTVRGSLGDASPDDFCNLLHIFTAIPGIPWTEALVHHGRPPRRPTSEEIKNWTRKVGPNGIASEFTVPKLKGPMTLDLFWKIIEKSRKDAEDDDQHGDQLLETLLQFSGEDLLEFDRLLSERLAESYRRDLWAVAYIALGGCSDDGFDYFQSWLVSQGRKYYEAALADPQKAVRRIEPGDEAEFERLLGIPREAYEMTTERHDFDERRKRVTRELIGAEWDEDDLPKRYPRLVRRYG